MSKKTNTTYAWVVKQTKPEQLQKLAPRQPASMCYVDSNSDYNEIHRAYTWDKKSQAREALSEPGEKVVRVCVTIKEV